MGGDTLSSALTLYSTHCAACVCESERNGERGKREKKMEGIDLRFWDAILFRPCSNLIFSFDGLLRLINLFLSHLKISSFVVVI